MNGFYDNCPTLGRHKQQPDEQTTANNLRDIHMDSSFYCEREKERDGQTDRQRDDKRLLPKIRTITNPSVKKNSKRIMIWFFLSYFGFHGTTMQLQMQKSKKNRERSCLSELKDTDERTTIM